MNLKLFERAITVAVAVLLGGCVAYSQNELAVMSAIDLCATQSVQGRNLSPKTVLAIQSELQRRNDNCSNHTADVAQRYEDFMWRETYGNQSP